LSHVFEGTHKIGDIVAAFPKAMDVFMEHNIDFCCGGNRPLSEALKEKNIDEDKIVDKLNALYDKYQKKLNDEIDMRNAPYDEMIDYIIRTHHTYLKHQLPIMKELVDKILEVHGRHHGEVLRRVQTLFDRLRSDLDEHLKKEEESIFPLIRKYQHNPTGENLQNALANIDQIEMEHTSAGDILKELRQITDQYKTPPDACTTFEMTYRKLEEMEADLFKHIHLENNILFPRLRTEKLPH
jgi:regulator of cell morphogenesis and NO signaling